MGALAALRDATDVALDATGLTSPHYRRASAVAGPAGAADVARLPHSQLRNATTGAFPSYDSFLTDEKLRHLVFDCLYCEDVELYRRACAQEWLRDACPRCAAECDAQLVRLAVSPLLSND